MTRKENKKTALIATLPKAGTWYSQTFFWCYDQLLRNAEDYLSGKFYLNLEETFKERKITTETSHSDTLGIDKLYICHTICPGYDELNDERRQRWEALHFPHAGYNWGEEYIRRCGAWDSLLPQINPHTRIVYLYRNPLDHFVSYFYHAQYHKDDSHRFKQLRNGERIPITNLRDSVFSFGMLSAFIKHFYTFKAVSLRFPDNILMISYEDLTLNPKKSFYDILLFLGAEPKDKIAFRLFEDALSMCTKESLTKIEEKLDICLANDLVGGARHIRGGEIGKWKNNFLQSELEAIEMSLSVFDLSLDNFILESSTSDMILPWVSQISSYKPLIKFFDNQLDEAGKCIMQLHQAQAEVGKCMMQLQAQAQIIQSFISSKSWRFTAPLRLLTDFFRRCLKRLQ